MEWPDYEFLEFPMMVYVDTKAQKVLQKPTDHPRWDPGNPRSKRWVQDEVIVHSEQELKELKATVETGGELKTVVSGPGVAPRLATAEDERQALLQEADVLGVQVDKRWGADKLKAAIGAFKEEAGMEEDVPV